MCLKCLIYCLTVLCTAPLLDDYITADKGSDKEDDGDDVIQPSCKF